MTSSGDLPAPLATEEPGTRPEHDQVPSARVVAPSGAPPQIDTAAIDSAWGDGVAPTRRGRPLLGPSLWIFGMLLWAYIVFGELVVNVNFPEPLAVLIVLAALAGTWWTSVGHQVPGMRRIAPGLIAIGLFAGLIALVSRVQMYRMKGVALMTIALVCVALVSFAAGRYLTFVPPPATRLRRAGRVVLWLTSGMATLVTLASAMSRL